MKLIKPGTTERAFNANGDITEVRYTYRTVHLDDMNIDVPDVLVGVDLTTDEIVTIPPQSLIQLKTARRLKEKPLLARLTPEYRDVLAVISQAVNAPDPDKFTHALVRLYLAEAQKNPKAAERLLRYAKQKTPQGTKNVTFRVLVEPNIWDWIETTTAKKTPSKSDLIRGAITAAKDDILDHPKKARLDQVTAVAMAV